VTVTDFPAAIRQLSAVGVEYIVVVGVAATIHGSAHITYDLDVVYRRTPENIERLAAALAPVHPYFRVEQDQPSQRHAPELVAFDRAGHHVR
jgi:hypothetical protein